MLVLLASLVFAAPAMAKPDPQLTALKKQVTQLRAQVQNLQLQVDQNRQLAICYYALGQDSFKIAFFALSRLTFGLTGTNVPAWEQIQRFDDQGSCLAVGVNRP
jgi:hypothetical protein